jgi:uncharacterized protein (TIGR03435 family)
MHPSILRVLLLAALLASVCVAQSGSSSPPEFEVASLRITKPAEFGYSQPGSYGTNRYTATNVTLDLLVGLAYGVPYQQISGSDKLGTEHYDLAAKAEDGVVLTYPALQPRLQRLLEQRFHLAVHKEEKEFDGYALTVAKGGPKLTPAKGSSGPGSIYPGGLRLMNLPLAGFASMIRSTVGSPVEDRTGITGNYDFEMKFARDDDKDSMLPSFPTALKEKFGLRLEKAKVKLEVVAIDHVDKSPAEN